MIDLEVRLSLDIISGIRFGLFRLIGMYARCRFDTDFHYDRQLS